MSNIIEIIPDNVPDWMIEAMAEGRLARACIERIDELKQALRDCVTETVYTETDKEIARIVAKAIPEES